MVNTHQANKDALQEAAIRQAEDHPDHLEREQARRELGWNMIQEAYKPEDEDR